MRFYTEPVEFPGEVRASVTYTTREGRRLQPIGHDFCQYYSSVLKRLEHSPRREWTERVVKSAIRTGLSEKTNVLHGTDYAIELVGESSDIRKRCYARFFSERPAVARFYGGEEYYGPLSVFAFLQCIIDALDPVEKRRFEEYLRHEFGLPDHG